MLGLASSIAVRQQEQISRFVPKSAFSGFNQSPNGNNKDLKFSGSNRDDVASPSSRRSGVALPQPALFFGMSGKAKMDPIEFLAAVTAPIHNTVKAFLGRYSPSVVTEREAAPKNWLA